MMRALFLPLTWAVALGTAQAGDAGPEAGIDQNRSVLGDVPLLSVGPTASSAAVAGPAPVASTNAPVNGVHVATPALPPVADLPGRPRVTRDRKSKQPAASQAVPDGMVAGDGDIERVMFRKAPIRIVLPVKKERMVTLPGAFAFHAPEGFEASVQSQIIERTAYLTALAPFDTLRVVAEDLSTGRQIPLDLVTSTEGVARPVEVFVPGTAARAAADGSVQAEPDADAPALDMVGLTRFAAQALYAPRRLVPSSTGVRQVPVNVAPAPGLYRGWNIETVPIGQWRSGGLYVTAVRFTNTGREPVDLDLDELRGRWLAATAQHSRLVPGDPAWNTTAVYLVCDSPFEACR